jgi:hypothetical protein
MLDDSMEPDVLNEDAASTTTAHAGA